ncbi:hypothetical protein [Rugosimonospora africana]|uniref:Uncharacterized protein n=1 Tax=Rugosimonospora africana TaxID=556532 RepID=A0A8J3R0U8_9ACTN|nr:hypothetical protein [Rugosimonospora africana]GIH20925.1 hypothetical protein Raf01_90970 [Rugosimonospora africana]
MSDPLTLASVGAVALTEGIKFLYAQAGEAIKAWRTRRNSNEPSAEVELAAPDAAFDHAPRQARIDFAVVGGLEQDLRDLRAALADLNDGIEEVDPHDHATLERVDGLRRLLEAVYGERFVFRGEPAVSSSAAIVKGEAVVEDVRGYVAGLRARKILGGAVAGHVRAGRVETGGRAVGVEVDSVG